MLPFLFALAACGPTLANAAELDPSSVAVSPDLVARYEVVRLALVQDKLDESHTAARELAAANAADQPVVTAANAVAASPDLTAARVAFGELSRVLIPRVASTSPAPKVLVYHCPMFQGYAWWFQSKAGIANPYMGIAMPACGSETSVKAAVKAASGAP